MSGHERKIRSPRGLEVYRTELAEGQLPDMACGVNGVSLQTVFRPECIDVEFDADGIVETRIYGRQVKADGSVGERWLDHRWRRL